MSAADPISGPIHECPVCDNMHQWAGDDLADLTGECPEAFEKICRDCGCCHCPRRHECDGDHKCIESGCECLDEYVPPVVDDREPGEDRPRWGEER